MSFQDFIFINRDLSDIKYFLLFFNVNLFKLSYAAHANVQYVPAVPKDVQLHYIFLCSLLLYNSIVKHLLE